MSVEAQFRKIKTQTILGVAREKAQIRKIGALKALVGLGLAYAGGQILSQHGEIYLNELHQSQKLQDAVLGIVGVFGGLFVIFNGARELLNARRYRFLSLIQEKPKDEA